METQIREEDDDEESSLKKPRKLLRLRRLVLPIFERFVFNGTIISKECDVTFACDGGHVHAHKIILAMVSTHFADMFKDQKPHKPSVVIIPDIKARTMKQIIALCYHKQVMIDVDNMTEITTWLSILGFGLEKFTFQLSSERMKTKPGTSITLGKHPEGSSEREKTTLEGSNSSSQTASRSWPFTVTDECGVEAGKMDFLKGSQSTSSRKEQTPTYWLDTTVCSQKESSEDTSSSISNKVDNDISQPQKLPSETPVIYGLPPGVGIGQRSNHGVKDGNSAETQFTSQVAKAPISNGSSNQKGFQGERSIVKPIKVGNGFIPPSLSRTSQVIPPKRLVASSSATAPRILKGGSAKMSKMQCSVCDDVFNEKSKWLWHIAHHQGNGQFKCTMCNLSFVNAKEVSDHELVEHNVTSTGVPGYCNDYDLKDTQAFKVKLPKLSRFSIPSIVSHENDKLPTSANTDKSNSPGKICKVSNSPRSKFRNHKGPSSTRRTYTKRRRTESTNSSIDDPDKVRWLYACRTCNHSSDSSVKAFIHHTGCNPAELTYEQNVVKYRQGHYGNYSCPLCPRKYITLYGFVVHCIHNHVEYKRTLSHVISEDKLMCVNCGDKFPGPNDFHGHLSSNNRCDKPAKHNKVTRYYRKYANLSSEDNIKTTNPTIRNFDSCDSDNSAFDRRNGIFVGHGYQNIEPSKKYYKTFLGSNPKSARLQNRLAAETAEPRTENLQPQNMPSASEVSVGNYISISCPVCGCTVKNLAEHLIKNHDELSARIERVEDSIFRCTICCVSFASCDLLAHLKSCASNEHPESEHTKIPDGKLDAKTTLPKKCKPILKFPDNIGKSPLDCMEKKDLSSHEILREAMNCGVCKRVSKKLSIISECLKTHGIFRCSLCFNTFMTNEERLIHLKQCHKDSNGKVKCPLCNEVRSNIGQVSSHLYLKHWASFFGKQNTKGSVQTQREAVTVEQAAWENSVNGNGNDVVVNGNELKTVENDVTDEVPAERSEIEQNGEEDINVKRSCTNEIGVADDGEFISLNNNVTPSISCSDAFIL